MCLKRVGRIDDHKNGNNITEKITQWNIGKLVQCTLFISSCVPIRLRLLALPPSSVNTTPEYKVYGSLSWEKKTQDDMRHMKCALSLWLIFKETQYVESAICATWMENTQCEKGWMFTNHFKLDSTHLDITWKWTHSTELKEQQGEKVAVTFSVEM